MAIRIPRSARSILLVLGLATLPAASVPAAMLLPGGDVLLNGALDELDYGATGTAFVTPYLYLGDLAAVNAPSLHAAVTLLDYGYTLDGLGGGGLTITYSLTNQDSEAFDDLRFIVDVQADGSGSFRDFAEVFWPAASPGDPDGYQVADFFEDLPSQIAANDGLDGSDTCDGAPCDVELALQWNLASLAPGATWQIVVGLSDDGSSLSDRRIVATSVDTGATVLTLSGAANLVPEPAPSMLVAGAIMPIVWSAWRLGRTARPRSP